MKKIIAALMLIGLVIGLIGCGGSPINADERSINIATQALEIVDDYLIGNISARTAHNRLSDLQDIRSNTDDVLVNSANGLLRAQISGLRNHFSRLAFDAEWTALGQESFGITTEDDILEARNSLASNLGVRAR